MQKYYLGLDIGTNSVGWAVTDENYNLCKFGGKRMWGIRLFDGAQTAEERRMNRSNRRRLSISSVDALRGNTRPHPEHDG